MRTLIALIPVTLAWAADPAEFFEMKVRPVLAGKCYACHSNSRMGGLDLTSREAALKGGNSGAAVVPGKPGESLLIAAVSHSHAKLKMPPAGKLPDTEVADLRAWVEAGAVWPERASKDLPPPAEYRISAEQRAYWAFQPVKRTPSGSIDSLWLGLLNAKGLKPNPSADRRTLIRRATIDLLGLPPDPASVEAFVADKSPDAWPKLIDKLLASPQYGERWGRYWLDVARYSDDQLASQFEIPHPSAFRYRDWVINAFNRDMPYDTFVKAQFAGDLIKGQEKNLAAGTGFFALSPEQQDDRVDAATRGFLGLTVACAQCHDHKFDPIPTTDYYSLLGIFSSTEKDEYPLADPVIVQAFKDHEKRLADKRKELLDVQNAHAKELAKIFAHDTARYLRAIEGTAPVGDLDAGVLERWRTYLKQKTHEHPFLKSHNPDQLQTLVLEVLAEKEKVDDENHIRLGSNPNRGDLSSADLLSLPRDKHYLWRDLFQEKRASVLYFKDRDLDRFLSAPVLARVETLRQQVKKLEDSLPERYPFLQTLSDVKEPKDIRVRIRGSADNLGQVATRRMLAILAKPEAGRFMQGSGRLELAEQIASKDNPLTARVMANRIWQGHFGRGLVGTSSNFGKLGETPSNPQLLDYLAGQLMDQGWSVKKLHREIMLSQAYQVSSTQTAASAGIDGDNRYQWRFNRRRLDIETLRDSLLWATGELNLEAGGQPRRLSDESNKRRTVYGFISRRDLDPTLSLFDFANPNSTSERRIETSTPLQRLYLLNSSFLERRADELSCRLEKAGADSARIAAAYRQLYQRAPTKAEVQAGLDYLKSGGTWLQYAQVLLAANEFVYWN
ncbi:MAG: PSD1 and planctomycete cytochrome C domain-containing protein [Acidobacteria bacterium]|nr:PSD1 and planctomycete cytochrome C domain-containing protein [Acidobacteriota bacterium]